MSRGWRAVLIVSLALNLAVVGLFAGAAFKHKGPPRGGDRYDPLVRALDMPARREIGKKIRAHRAEGMGTRAELTGIFDDILAALRAPEFDEAELRAALARKTALLRQTRDVGEAALIAHLSGLSTDERAEFAARLEDKLKRRRH